jgi:hypothetical protein
MCHQGNERQFGARNQTEPREQAQHMANQDQQLIREGGHSIDSSWLVLEHKQTWSLNAQLFRLPHPHQASQDQGPGRKPVGLLKTLFVGYSQEMSYGGMHEPTPQRERFLRLPSRNP